MTELNEEKLTITLTETLTWDNHMQYYYDEFVEFAKYEVENEDDSYSDDDIEELKEFIGHQLTNKDKCEMLHNVIENYTYETYRTDCYTSLFDEAVAKKSIEEWIDEKYNFIVGWAV